MNRSCPRRSGGGGGVIFFRECEAALYGAASAPPLHLDGERRLVPGRVRVGEGLEHRFLPPPVWGVPPAPLGRACACSQNPPPHSHSHTPGAHAWGKLSLRKQLRVFMELEQRPGAPHGPPHGPPSVLRAPAAASHTSPLTLAANPTPLSGVSPDIPRSLGASHEAPAGPPPPALPAPCSELLVRGHGSLLTCASWSGSRLPRGWQLSPKGDEDDDGNKCWLLLLRPGAHRRPFIFIFYYF